MELARCLSTNDWAIRATPQSVLEIIFRLMRAAEQEGRIVCLETITELSSVIAQLGGERALRESAQAILDTAKWWR